MFGESETGGFLTPSIKLIYMLPWRQRKRLRCIGWLSEMLHRIFFPGVVFSLFSVFLLAIPFASFVPGLSAIDDSGSCLLCSGGSLGMPPDARALLKVSANLVIQGSCFLFFPCCLSRAVLAPDAGVPLVCALSPVFVFLESAAADLA
jgi:hypothetical protein